MRELELADIEDLILMGVKDKIWIDILHDAFPFGQREEAIAKHELLINSVATDEGNGLFIPVDHVLRFGHDDHFRLVYEAIKGDYILVAGLGEEL